MFDSVVSKVSQPALWLVKRPILLAVIVGLCLGAGFVWPVVWWLSLIGIIISILYVTSEISKKQIILFFFMSWWIKYLFVCSPVLSTYPLTWLGLELSQWQLLAVGFFWITCSVWLALGGVIVGSILVFVRQYVATYSLLLFPFMWLVGEVMASLFFSIFLYGEGGTINFNFSAGMIGYAYASASSGLWLAAWYGVYGLSLLWVSLAVLIVAASKQFPYERYLVAGVMSGIFLVATISVMGGERVSKLPVSVITIHTQFDTSFLPQSGQATKVDILHEAVTENLDQGADFIVIPEDSGYLNYQFGDMSDETSIKLARFLLPRSETVIVDSGSAQIDSHSVLRGYILDVAQSSLYFYDKQYLVPHGEFVPYVYGTLFTATGFGTGVERIKRSLSYRPSDFGDQHALPLRYPSLMFCFESINPRSAHQLAKRGNIPFVAHPISHAWFNQPTVLWQQQDVMLQVQARWAGVPIVSAGNMMIGKAYLPDGRIDYGSVIATGDRWEARLIEF